jgi:hypothetical protein
MDNVLENMVQRLRGIELLLKTQNVLLTRVLAELEQIRHSGKVAAPENVVVDSPVRGRSFGLASAADSPSNGRKRISKR